MARQKLGSRDLKKAKLRLGNLEAVSPTLDLGDGLNNGSHYHDSPLPKFPLTERN